MENCGKYFIAHDEAIKQSKQDIENLYNLLNGLPNDVQNIMTILKEIKECNSKNDEKYMSKEIVLLMLDNLKKEIKLWMVLTGISVASSVLLLGIQIYQVVVR